jgi:hypothetical protein
MLHKFYEKQGANPAPNIHQMNRSVLVDEVRKYLKKKGMLLFLMMYETYIFGMISNLL